MLDRIVANRYVFNIDEVGRKALRGWIYNKVDTSRPVRVSIAVDGRTVHDFYTDSVRADVNDRFSIRGEHGFVRKLPLSCFDGKAHDVKINVVENGKSHVLKKMRFSNDDLHFRYHVDGLDAKGIRGWICNTETPLAPLKLRLIVDGEIIEEFAPSVKRQDVNTELEVEGVHGFRYPLPLVYFDGIEHDVQLVCSCNGEHLVYNGVFKDCDSPVRFALDTFEPYFVSGWCFALGDNKAPLSVRMVLNGKEVNRLQAIDPRMDVKKRFDTDGMHGFSSMLPPEAMQPERNTLAVYAGNDEQEYCLACKVVVRNVEPLVRRLRSAQETEERLREFLAMEVERLGQANRLRVKELKAERDVEVRRLKKVIAALTEENNKLAQLARDKMALDKAYQAQRDLLDELSEMIGLTEV